MTTDCLPDDFPRRIRARGGSEVACSARLLEADDVDAVYALHREAIHGMGSELVASETLAFFVDHVARAGRLCGVVSGTRLIAYAVLGLPGAGDPNFGTDLDLGAEDLARVAHLDGVGVLPDFRGNGLQCALSRWRLALATRMGRTLAMSTAAPGNRQSVHNMLASGLQIRGLRVKFGGWRYMLATDASLAERPAEGGQWLEVADLVRQQTLLAQGWRGWTLDESGHRVLFAPLDDSAPAKEGGQGTY
ncbi:MAG: hypothetical protein ACK4KV_22480 [Rhodocyclaceae bacterium]